MIANFTRAVAVLVALSGIALAQIPEPEIRSIFPAGGKAGDSFEVEVQGANLDDPERLVFSHPGIKGETILCPPTPLTGRTWKLENRYSVAIAPDVPPGAYTVRFLGAFGVSSARAFVVGDLPEIRELKSDVPFAKGTVFNGRCSGNEAREFLLHLAAGERVDILCESAVIDSAMEPAMQVIRPDGGRLVKSTGERLSFVAEAAGVYRLMVWDYVFRGGNNCLFRLQWGNEAPKALAATSFRWPESESIGEWGDLSDGKADAFLIEAKKGQSFWVEAVSERIGFPTDLAVRVEKVAEPPQTIATADDVNNAIGSQRLPLSTRDPSLRFTADEDATYRVVVHDQFAAGELSRYQMQIIEAGTDFQLLALVSNPYDDGKQTWDASPVLRRSGTVLIDVYALRRQGFNGEIELSVDGLPGGVVAEGDLFIPEGSMWGTIVLRAEKVNENWLGPVSIEGRAGNVARVAYDVRLAERVSDFQIRGPENRVHRGHILRVLAEDAPLQVSAPKGKVFLTALGGSLDIPVALARSAGLTFKNGVIVSPVEYPGMKKAPQLKIDDKTGEGVLKLDFTNKDNNQFDAGVFRFRLRADSTVSYAVNNASKVEAEGWKKEAEVKVNELEAERKSAAEAKQKAETAFNQARQEKQTGEQINAAKITLDVAAKALTAAEEKKRLGEEEKRIFTERAKQAAERANPRDLKVITWSPPVTVVLSEAPLEIVSTNVAPAFEIGKIGNVEMEIERLYGFVDEVTIVAELPDETAKVASCDTVVVAKDQTKLVVKFGIKPDAPVGDYRAKLRLKMKFGVRDVSIVQELLLHVIAPAISESPKPVSE